MILSRRELILISILVLVAGAYLLDYFWLQPLTARSSQLDATSLILQNQWKQNENVYARYSSTDQQKEIIAAYGAMRAQVPEEPMIANIIEFMESVARETGTVACSVRYDAQIEPQRAVANRDNEVSLQAIRFIINTRGSWTGLLTFLQRIEAAPRLLNITRTRIKAVMTDPLLLLDRDGEGGQSIPATAESPQSSVLNAPEPDLYELEIEVTAYYRE